MFDTWCRWMFYPSLHKMIVYRHFSYFQYGFQNGHQRSHDYFFKWKFYVLATFCERFIAIGWMVLEILCVEPIYLQYSGVFETCLALRYWFFEVLGSKSVNTLWDILIIFHRHILIGQGVCHLVWWLFLQDEQNDILDSKISLNDIFPWIVCPNLQ